MGWNESAVHSVVLEGDADLIEEEGDVERQGHRPSSVRARGFAQW